MILCLRVLTSVFFFSISTVPGVCFSMIFAVAAMAGSTQDNQETMPR